MHLRTEHGCVILHDALHIPPDLGGQLAALGIPDLVQVGDGGLSSVGRQLIVWRARLQGLGCSSTGEIRPMHTELLQACESSIVK